MSTNELSKRQLYRVSDQAGAQWLVDELCESGDLVPVKIDYDYAAVVFDSCLVSSIFPSVKSVVDAALGIGDTDATD